MLQRSTSGHRVVILTALPVEYRAVHAHLSDLTEEIHPLGTIYERGYFSSGDCLWDVGIAEVGAGNMLAAFEAERAIAYFKPRLVLFVGVAGGLRDVQLGDVVAATKVYGYESGKVKKIFEMRPSIGQSSYRLEQRARAEARKQDWLQRIKSRSTIVTHSPKVFVAPIAAGEKVMADTRAPILRTLKHSYSDALAVEMESIGFLLAARANYHVDVMIIRGISDLIDNKAEADTNHYQEIAADHASAFAFQVLARLDERTLQPPMIAAGRDHLSFAVSSAASQRAMPLHNLPQPDYTRFIGRQDEMQWLRQRLAPDSPSVLIALTGIGGIGKSSLGQAIASEYCQRYPSLPPKERFEAIIWISAKAEILTVKGREQAASIPFSFRTLEDIYRTIAQTLEREDITRAVFDEQHYFVEKVLRSQRTLLIIDNLETITDKRVETFLRNLASPTKCILTSRHWVEAVDHLKLIGLTSSETEALITEEASRREVILSTEQQRLLFQCTGGLPLPIKLSIARLASEETFEQVMRWLDNASSDLPAHCVQSQIATVCEYGQHCWRLLLACSLFEQTSGVSREAVGVVTGLSPHERDDGLTLLQRLSLLSRTSHDRFSMLPIVRSYVGAELAREACRNDLIEAWLQWLLQFARRYGNRLDLHIEHVQTVSTEYAAILGGIRWCREHGRWETLLQLAENIWFYPYLIGLLSEAREILADAILAAQFLKDEPGEGRFLRRLALSFWVQGEYETSWSNGLQKAEQIALCHQDMLELGRVYHIHADILAHQQQMRKGKQLADKMLTIGKESNYVKLKALAVYRLSEFAAQQGQIDKAIALLDKGEDWSREAGWLRCLAWNKYLRGATLIKLGSPQEAEPFLKQSLEMATSWCERTLMANTSYGLAQIYKNMGQFQLAYQMAELSFDLYERLGASRHISPIKELLSTTIKQDSSKNSLMRQV